MSPKPCLNRMMHLITLAAAALLAFGAGAAPTTQPASSVRGVVLAESEVPLAEMVLYLESADPAAVFAPATQPMSISQKDAQFSPRMAIVTVGQTVNFVNDESRDIEHNVFSNSVAKRFDLGLFGPGQSKRVSFDKPGPVFLYCSIHRYMDGVIFVSPTPYISRVEADGHFAIDGVPPGKWTLKTWQRRRRFPELSIPIVVEADRPSVVPVELKHK